MKTSMAPKKTTNSPAPPAPWAARSGQDAFGAFADLEVKGQVQRFRWCPPGRFVMGSPFVENQRNVTLTRGFWMADTPVTQGFYAAVMGRNPSQFRSAFLSDLPVERVSWYNVMEFVGSVNRLTPLASFRLPTEAEWEYAARAGTTGERYGPAKEVAWTSEDSFDRPHRVGQKLPNPWGLYDTLGNVWEWVEDWYARFSNGDLVDPKGPRSGSSRVLRGGAWNFEPHFSRFTERAWDDPFYRSDDLGFRLVRDGTWMQPSPQRLSAK
jgi:formylglycine-generating enzyme required for sulfatase activity